MASHLNVDKAACISCQLCIDVLPTVFQADSEGLAEVHDSEGASKEDIEKAIDACPAKCISWETT
jgi:ferredoxin